MEHVLIVQAEHVAIFEAIEAQDRDAACRAMRRHIQNACRRVFEGPDSNVPRRKGWPTTGPASSKIQQQAQTAETSLAYAAARLQSMKPLST